jgi:hypothetical protein
MEQQWTAWQEDLSLSINAGIIESVGRARAAGVTPQQIMQTLIACFTARLCALTPDGHEAETIVVIGESFDVMRPGWRGRVQ